ncbi:MAG: ABC transporter permease subunit, partial [Actinomycetota bacterium]
MIGRLPRFRLEGRTDLPRFINWTVPLCSFLVALAAGALLLLATGQNPVATYQRIVERAFLGADALNGTLVAATPLLFTGLCAAVAFRIGFFNLGGEGQFYIGAIAGSGVALALGADTRVAIAVPVMVVAGAAGGALWAAVPGVLRAYFRTNEIITSLMLNYVAGILAVYLIFESDSFWRDLEGSGKLFPKGRIIP